MATFHDQFVRLARQLPDRVALDDDNRCVTFGQLPALIDRYCSCLTAAGVRPGATVGVTVRQDVVHLLVTLALFRLAAHQVTLPSFEKEASHDDLIERLGLSHSLLIAEDIDAAAPPPADLRIRALAGRCSAPALSPPLFYFPTSGTTGRARITAMTEAHLIARVERRALCSDRVLITASSEHGHVMRSRLHYLHAGVTLLFCRSGLSWNGLADIVAHRNVTGLCISPLEAKAFAETARPDRAVNAQIYVAGTRIPWSLRQVMRQRLSKTLLVAYGTTESGSIAVAGPAEHDERETVGRPHPGVLVEIVNGGVVLPPGNVGDLRVRAPGMIDGYFDDPKETAARFRGGWFYPGDLATLTGGGQLILHGRRDDMMMMSGINIYPLELERVLEAHPAVSAAAAFAIKSRLHGDIPAAAVELAGGARASEDVLIQHARDRLGVRYPRKIVIVDAIPRDRHGKILKKEIAASFQRVISP